MARLFGGPFLLAQTWKHEGRIDDAAGQTAKPPKKPTACRNYSKGVLDE